MQGLAICSKGSEKIAKKEIIEIAGAENIELGETTVKFECKDLKDLLYRSQSTHRIIQLLSEFNVSPDLDVKDVDFNSIKNAIKGSLQVFCVRSGEHNFRSVDFSGAITKGLSTDFKIDYDNPDNFIFAYIYNDKGFLGIDPIGKDLSKREYKLFNHPESLKGTTAYALVRESDFKPGQILLDPFMGSGIIPIEAALFDQRFPVRYYSSDKIEKPELKKTNIHGFDSQLRYLKAAQKNARLAGVHKIISLSKREISWLDTYYDENTVDCIVTDPPRLSKKRDNDEIIKLYNELFYQSQYILTKKGCVVVLTRDPEIMEKHASRHKFKIATDYTINQGQEEFHVMKFRRV